MNDMYSERNKPVSDHVGETDDEEDPDALIDLYSERMKRMKKRR